jgi:hypothetical protein
VALQTLLPKRPAGGNRGTHHREFHNINLLMSVKDLPSGHTRSN